MQTVRVCVCRIRSNALLLVIVSLVMLSCLAQRPVGSSPRNERTAVLSCIRDEGLNAVDGYSVCGDRRWRGSEFDLRYAHHSGKFEKSKGPGSRAA